ECRRYPCRVSARGHHRVPALCFIPNRLNAKLSLLESAVHSQLHCKRLHRQLRRATELARTLREYMEETLFKAASFVALPVFIIFGTQVDDVFTRDVGRTTGRREHFTLHGRFDFSRDLYQKLLPDATRFGMLVGCFQQVLAGFAVNPFSYRLKQPQTKISCFPPVTFRQTSRNAS